MNDKFRAFAMEEQTPLILFYSEASFKLSEFLNPQARHGPGHGAPGRHINWGLALANK